MKSLNQAVAIAAMCLQEEQAARPLMSDVVTALNSLTRMTSDGSAYPLSSSEASSRSSNGSRESV